MIYKRVLSITFFILKTLANIPVKLLADGKKCFIMT